MPGDDLEREAEALVEIFNEAAAVHSPELEWFGMGLDREPMEETFVFQAAEYMDNDGLEALREHGRVVRYIEGYEYEGEVYVQIELSVQGEVPEVVVDA